MTSGPRDSSPMPKCRDTRTARFAAGERVKEFQSFARQAHKRLEIRKAAPYKVTLMRLPSNPFEARGGSRVGQFSIRINDQWRTCFEWPNDAPRPYNIEMVDYH
jgi:proteic killer suppression protein